MSEPELTPQENVLAAYEWADGVCFRCGCAGRTAVVGQLGLESGSVDLRACAGCVLDLEREREKAALRYGWPYVPGQSPP